MNTTMAATLDDKTLEELRSTIGELVDFAKDSQNGKCRHYILCLLRSLYCRLYPDYNEKFGKEIFDYIEKFRREN